ncbi:MAG: ATP-dependent helicase [Halanaerobiales bacterium]|nr:ATP-dependent helicase [Halanaerobiales bacterium]
MISLRPGQKEVAEYRKGFMAVPAVPGAGKTTVLAYLASTLIEEGHTRPGKILVVTVMNSAVSNFRARIGNFLEERGLSRNRGFEVKTLHSLAMSILKEKPEFLLINNEFQIIDESKQWNLIAELTQQWIDHHEDKWKSPIGVKEDTKWHEKAVEKWTQSDLPRFMKGMISYIKSQGVTIEDIKKLKRNLNEDSFLYWAFEIYEEYSKILYRNGLLDFDDLILQALKLLQKDEQLCQRLRKRWTYIFEDEAQDSNPLQEKILHLLAGEDGNLVRVGDSNQAIMGTFTSADTEIFRGFCQSTDVKKESILYSSRSSVDIINLANYLVKWSRGQHPQNECRDSLEDQLIHPVDEFDLYPNPTTENYTIAVKRYVDSKQEIQEVAQLAHRHVKDNPKNTVAIIVPNRFIQEEAAEKLKEMGANYEEVGKINSDQAKTIYDLKSVIQYLAEPHKVDMASKLIRNVLLSDFTEEILGAVDQLLKRYSLEELVYPIGGEMPWLDYPDELFDPELLAAFNHALDKLRLWLDASVAIPPDELVLFLAEQMEFINEPLAVAQNIALQIKSELNVNPGWKLLDIANELPRLEPSFRRFVKVLSDQKGFEPKPGFISLITAHKSKGLEWDTVYLTSLTVAEFPASVEDNFRSEYWYLADEVCNPTALAKAQLKFLIGNGDNVDPLKSAKVEEISERLRLLYVAITRAKKNLLLTFPQKIIFNANFTKEIDVSRPIIALNKFITEERKRYVGKESE